MPGRWHLDAVPDVGLLASVPGAAFVAVVLGRIAKAFVGRRVGAGSAGDSRHDPGRRRA